MTKVSECLTLFTCIASIRDFVDPHTDIATLKQWIIEDLGGNFSFTIRGIVASVIGFKHVLVFQWLTTTTSLGQYLQQFPRLWSTPSETFCKTFNASPIARALGVRKPPGGGVHPEKFGRGVRPASQNPYPIYDQNLWFSLPFL